MSFFKKNSANKKKAKNTPKAKQTKLQKEIADMDRDRHLDMQLEELTASLNSKSDTVNTPNENTAKTQDEPTKVLEYLLEEEAEEPSDLDSLLPDTLISGDLTEFTAPNFVANLDSKVKHIDVTEQLLPVTPSIEKSISQVHEEAEAIKTEQNVSLQNLKVDDALSGPSRLDMGEMRVDVAKISADIQSGEELYRRALQRVEGLMGFVEKAEVDFSVLNRLEPENRRLKAKLRTTNGELEDLKSKVGTLSANLEDHQARLDDKTKQYEEAHSKLSTAASSLQEYKRVLQTTKSESERYALAIERHKTALSVEGKENKVLREKIGELSRALENRQTEFLEASKMVESLKADCADYREQTDTSRTETQDLRIALNTAKRQNNAMKGEMKSLHEDIKTFKTQYEFTIINREDQLTDLETQVSFLAKEVDIKTELANSAAQDVASLRSIRNEQDIERDRLEKQLIVSKEEIKDVTSLVEARTADKLTELQSTANDLKSEVARRDTAAKLSEKEKLDLQRKVTTLELECDSLQSRLDVQAQQLESTIKNNPTAELETQIQNLTQQLKIKDDIVKSAAKDVSELRQARSLQMTEQKRLEDTIHAQTFELEVAQKALLASKHAETELDQKYKDIAAALSVNQSRKQANNPSKTPDISPDISDEFTELTDEGVEDRIMDYKFGIRKDIV